MPRYKIETVINATSPLHISEPGQHYWNPNTRSFASSNANGAFPVTRTKSLPVANSNGGDNEESGGRKLIPYYPGNSLRGAIRRAAGELVFKALERRGETISFDLYHIILCGAASASPDKSATITEAVEAAKHPFAGMFGGGPKLIHGRLSIGNSFVITKETVGRLVPTSMTDMGATSPWVTAVMIDTHVDDVLRGTGRVPTVVEDFEKHVADWIGKLAESRTKRDADDDSSKKLGIATIMGREVIIPGTRLHGEHFVDTELAGPAMLGLFVLALAGFANAQRLGGGARNGCGRFTLTAAATGPDGESVELLLNSDGNYVPNKAQPLVGEAIAAWEKFANTISAAQIAQVFGLKNA
jgi:CRISPR type IV-associated protein Csf2